MNLLASMARMLLASFSKSTIAKVGAGTVAGSVIAKVGVPGVDLLGNGEELKPRRRRRKMFTDTDLAQFAAAEGIAGRKAAATLMMIRAAKS